MASEKQLSAKIEAFRSQKEVIKAQYSAAEAQVQIGEAATGIGERDGRHRARDPAGPGQDRGDAGARVRGRGARSRPGTLEDFTSTGQRLDRELAQLASQSQVDSELEKLKAELGAGGKKKELEEEKR